MKYFLIAVVVVLGSGIMPVAAGLSAPIPFAKLSEDESRILVMRDGGEGFCEQQLRYPRLSTGERIDFLEQFPRSGVYSLPDRKLIYGIDWFCLEHELLASPDLANLARLNRFGGGWALKFYSNGKETATYETDQLMKMFRGDFFRPFVTWDYYYPWCDEFELSGQEVTVTTVRRRIGVVPFGYWEVYAFDIATGSMRKSDVKFGRLLAVITGILLVAGLLAKEISGGLRRRRRKMARLMVGDKNQ